MLFVKANYDEWSAQNPDAKDDWEYQLSHNGEAIASIRRDVLNSFVNENRDVFTDSNSNKRYSLHEEFIKRFRDELANRFPAVFQDFPVGAQDSETVSEDFKKFEAALGMMYGPRF